MFNQIFISYLMQQEYLSPENTAKVLDLQKHTKVRIGTLAQEAKLMTSAQIDEVNRLQAHQNARFGDIAVNLGYIRKADLDILLGKQLKEHVVLKQIICDRSFMTFDEFDDALKKFRLSLGVNNVDFSKLQENSVEAYIKHVAGIDENDLLLTEYATTFITMALRLIDREIRIARSYKAKLLSVKNVAATQSGARTFYMICPDENAALKFAEAYVKDAFDGVFHFFSDDAKNTIAHFLGYVAELVAKQLPPANNEELVSAYYDKTRVDGIVTIIPFYLNYGEFCVFVKY